MKIVRSKMADKRGAVSIDVKSRLLAKIKAKQCDLEVTNTTKTSDMTPRPGPSSVSNGGSAALEPDVRLPFTFLSLQAYFMQMQIKGLLLTEVPITKVKSCLELHRELPDIQEVSRGGPLFSARAVILQDGTATLQVLHKTHCVLKLADKDSFIDENAFQNLISLFDSQHYLCVGLKPSEFAEMSKGIHINLKNKVEYEYPFERVHSSDCSVWFKASKNLSRHQKQNGATCGKCKYFYRYVNHMRISNERGDKKLLDTRLKASSNFSISKLTPKSKKKRLQANARKRGTMKRQLRKYEDKLSDLEIQLSEEQNMEMERVVSWINKNAISELETIFCEELGKDSSDVSDLLRDTWIKDTEDRSQFYKDQFRNHGKESKNGHRWSMITYRIALAIYIRSPSAYKSLKSFKILELPSVKSLQMFTATRNHSSGINEEYIQEKQGEYQLFCEETVRKGLKKPLSLGVLIFDEVKVIAKVAMNMKSEQFMGLAMTEEEMTNIHDIYKVLDSDSPVPAEYMLQYLWRDLTSSYDIIGPYFSLKSTIDHHIVIETLFETMRVFHNYGFETAVIVCDGASCNLSAIKMLSTCKRGAYGINPEGQTKHEIKPMFKNPFKPSSDVYFVICPSHQLKNHINALFSSRNGGTKGFQMETHGTKFGWKTIINMWQRECTRAESGQMRKVLKLLPSYVERDAWTKLNVAPAKIMQQDNVLTELYEHGSQTSDIPDDKESVLLTRNYLIACNKLFERGILSNNRISNSDKEILQNIEEGYHYFERWWESLNRSGDFRPTSSFERRFISWQTWDLLRVMVFGFLGFAESFLAENPEYYIFPLKVNGSAAETLFSQFKAETNSKLTSVNYPTARNRILMKKDIHGSAKAAHGYRDTPLYVKEKVLKRKIWGKKQVDE